MSRRRVVHSHKSHISVSRTGPAPAPARSRRWVIAGAIPLSMTHRWGCRERQAENISLAGTLHRMSLRCLSRMSPGCPSRMSAGYAATRTEVRESPERASHLRHAEKAPYFGTPPKVRGIDGKTPVIRCLLRRRWRRRWRETQLKWVICVKGVIRNLCGYLRYSDVASCKRNSHDAVAVTRRKDNATCARPLRAQGLFRLAPGGTLFEPKNCYLAN